MALGFGVLRLSPGTFWAMTLRELTAALAAVAGQARAAPPSRAELSRLMQTYPDV